MVFLKRLLILLLLFPLPAYAGTYWVDTTGGAELNTGGFKRIIFKVPGNLRKHTREYL